MKPSTIDSIMMFLINWLFTTIGVFLSFGGMYWAYLNPEIYQEAEWVICLSMALGVMFIARHAPKTK